ncbi:Aste57867_15551 [Aphanomyces stellatus]|uniref:Aste57867_15551 protein n=1 Tax=Aphanomyces stellatus TaxID=120398 RepID=A0A485L3Z3_9STRA|nr:hypothetical protein As57867_015495 [Aphanomyces stellatus]VFT92353.1 Aste57867_15551 [Aphanomyces stellatus]
MAPCRIYVGQVPAWLLVEKKARGFFDKYGEVTALDIHKDPRDTQAPGFCFVTFADTEAATHATVALQEERARNESQMVARIALARGPARIVTKEENGVDFADKFMHASQKLQLSQATQDDDDDEFFFQSLSQRSSQGAGRRFS